MVALLISLVFITFWHSHLTPFNNNYLGKSQGTAVKGVFIILVFLSHLNSYLDISSESIFDATYLSFFDRLGQLMVVMFLFYSGYGVLKSYKEREGYSKTFFKNRILKTLLNFDICLIPFAILSFVLGSEYSVYEYLLSLVGWESIGNSNWYIFIVLMLYLISFLAMCLTKKQGASSHFWMFILTGILSVVLVGVLRYVGRESWWYNTILCYSFGMFFACFEELANNNLRKNIVFIISAFCSFCLLLLLLSIGSIVSFMFGTICFALLIVTLSSRIIIGNKVLIWLGDHLFEIFILQRIPMIILKELQVQNKLLFVLVSFIVTICLAFLCKKLLRMIDDKLFY